MIENLYNYYSEQHEPQKSCLLVLRDIILASDENISETMKYGMPCFCYKKKMFCFLWIDKKTNEPYILFVDGKFIDHSALEMGNRALMKILRINPDEDICIDTIREILTLAIKLRQPS